MQRSLYFTWCALPSSGILSHIDIFIKTILRMKKYITEFIGTFFLVLVIGLTVIGGTGTMAAFAIGSTLMVMVYAGGHISGAHYNPAVTLGVLIRGRISVMDAVVYVAVQIAAAALAALLVRYFLAEKMPTTASLNPDAVKAMVGELVGTFALVYVVLNVATAKANAGNSYFGLAIGFTVGAMVYALGSFSGGAFNPAVATAALFMKMASFSDIWLYLVGCFGGAAIAALIFLLNNPEDRGQKYVMK
jgi:aquaporin Z